MTASTLQYEEAREIGFLERLILRRSVGVAQALLFLCASLSIGLALFHLYAAMFGAPEGRSFRSTHLTVMLLLAVFMKPLFRPGLTAPVLTDDARTTLLRALGLLIDLTIVVGVLAVQVWTLYDIDDFHLRYGDREPGDLLAGLVIIAIVLEATRRMVGWAMVIITLFFVMHALFANHFIGFFYGPPVRFEKFIDTLFMSTDGLFGIPLHVCATYIILFIIFGALLVRSGAGRFFIELAVALTGRSIGGPAKAAAVASGFMGTVSGSAVANVVTTGSFTIPMMKKLGYRPKFAAAVEACASSGGQITPPIMGAAAFIMAEFLGVSYLTIIVAAAIPAFLYFATIYFMVHLEAEKHGVGSLPPEQIPDVWEVLRGGWHLLIALGVLIAFLVVGYTPMKSAFFGLAALLALSFINPSTRMSPVDILAALEDGVRATVPVAIACACAGLIIGSVFVSGLGLKFTQSVIDLSGGNLFILLCLTGVAAIILGMGITTTAVYITVAALIVPAVVKIGVEPIAAHMFAFYFGVVSTITPPVALAAFAAAAIAKTGPMATALESTRVGIAKYLAPLAFVYNPALLFVGPLWLTAVSTVLALAAMWSLSVAMEGWLKGPIGWPRRVAAGAAAIMLLAPPMGEVFGLSGWMINMIGAAVAMAALWRGASAVAPAPAASSTAGE
ncbi:MAG: TRAP transporter permease [Rhodobacteraceae bacterium]|nr:TRAP transporter permease [Paracoccaceae bacterium]